MMVGFGVMGWALRKLDVPLVPVILGTLLGNAMESNLRRAITISDGDWSTLLASPLSITLWLVAIAGFVLPMVVGKMMQARLRAARHGDIGEEMDEADSYNFV